MSAILYEVAHDASVFYFITTFTIDWMIIILCYTWLPFTFVTRISCSFIHFLSCSNGHMYMYLFGRCSLFSFYHTLWICLYSLQEFMYCNVRVLKATSQNVLLLMVIRSPQPCRPHYSLKFLEVREPFRGSEHQKTPICLNIVDCLQTLIY